MKKNELDELSYVCQDNLMEAVTVWLNHKSPHTHINHHDYELVEIAISTFFTAPT